MDGMDEREKHVYMAKLAEQAERYDEMVEAMKKVARLDVELTAEKRNLLSVGYKNVIGAKRTSWRILSSIEQNEEAKGNEHNVMRVKGYIKRVDDELAKACNEILSIIAIHLLPSSTSGESIVFFYKMKRDYYRYLAEFKTKNERREAADQSLRAYQAATSTAMMDLPPTHSIRLGLALNFSVFYYEILNSPERACHLAKQAFDEAIAELDTLSADSYKDSTLIMQLLKDNLTLWTSDLPEENDEAELSNEFLDTEVDWILGLKKVIHLKDLPTFMRVTDSNDKMFNYILHETSRAFMASTIVLNTFEVLEVLILAALQKILQPV